MNIRLILWQTVGLIATSSVAFADEFLPTLKAGSEVYSNVTVTEISATDIYFSFKGGMGNAKLKNLSPEMQKHFHFNPTNAAAAELKQRESNIQFRTELASRKTAAASQSQPPTETVPPPAVGDDGDLVVPKLYAKSVRGRRPPQIIVDQWLTPAPEVNGKFVLVDFWATWCGPCRKSIPHLNDLQAKFAERLVVIGLSDEDPDEIRKMTSPKVNYWVGTDTQGRTKNALEVIGIPHAILIDPQGIVRFEGMPTYLDEKTLSRLIEKYGQ